MWTEIEKIGKALSKIPNDKLLIAAIILALIVVMVTVVRLT